MIRRTVTYGPAVIRLGDREDVRDGRAVRVWYASATIDSGSGRVHIRAEVDETVLRALYARALDWSRQAAMMLGFPPAEEPRELVAGEGWDLFRELDKFGRSQVLKDITRTVDQVVQSPEMRAAMQYLPYGELVRGGLAIGTGTMRGATEAGPEAAARAALGRGLAMLPPAPPAPKPAGVIAGEDAAPRGRLPGPARATVRLLARIGRAKAGDAAARADLERLGRRAQRGSVRDQRAAALASAMADAPALSEDVAGWLEGLAGVTDDEAGAAAAVPWTRRRRGARRPKPARRPRNVRPAAPEPDAEETEEPEPEAEPWT